MKVTSAVNTFSILGLALPLVVAGSLLAGSLLAGSLLAGEGGAAPGKPAAAAGPAPALSSPNPTAAHAAAADIGYNRDIRPILSDNCFACHGPDKAKRKGKFRLDERESAIKKEAIVPGKPDQSTLVDRIYTKDPDDIMPPAETHKVLTKAQRDLLKRWVAQGASYEAFWAYVVPKRPAVPEVKQAGWVRNPIDAFILHELEAKGIAPSREADRRTLLRRLSLDLIGLPPTPQEVQAFLDDKSPDAYEKQVDRLLANPHYGERMAVPWLDAVRFADTVGFHGDQNQNVFPYRDYVINAFNSDKPFDQFTIEQLAGDLLPDPVHPHPTTEQLVASGFNRLNMVTREGGAQPKEYLAKYAADRVRTLGSAFLGSTLACCECHDHKFVPFTTRDFYSLEAFWADVKEWGVYMDYGYTPNPDLKGFSNDSPFPPEIVVDSPYLQHREQGLLAKIDAVASEAGDKLLADPTRRAEFERWRGEVSKFLEHHPSGWETAEARNLADEQSLADAPHKPPPEGAAAVTAPGEVGAVLFPNHAGDNDSVEFALPPGFPPSLAAVRLEALPHEKHNGSMLRGGSPSAMVQLTAALHSKATNRATRLTFSFADADRKEPQYSSGFEILGITRGWKTSASHVKEPQTAVYLLDSPAKVAEGDMLRITLPKNMLGCVRVSVSPLAPLRPTEAGFAEQLRASLKTEGKDVSPAAVRTFLLSTPLPAGPEMDARAAVRQLVEDVLECRDGKSPTVVTVAKAPRLMRILRRGNWQDEGGDIVQPATPEFLSASRGATAGRRLNRLDLARWLVAPDNPLTARTFVNRTWKQFFGNGLCNTVEDLGAQGEMPSHPELLDWLAVEFRDKGWDVKHMVRLMVTSATYRQDSDPRPELKEIDPNNQLLASQNPRRLEAEFVRDNALAAAGLLNDAEVGGPSVHPYQPEGYYANIQFPDRKYVPEADNRQYRRGVYVHRQRTFEHPMLANFDAPSREDSVCTRVVSNTPQQALTLLNDPSFVEAARVLAAHVMAAAPEDGGRLAAVYERVLARELKAKERESLTKFLAEQRDYYRANPQDAEKLEHVGFAPVQAGVDPSELAAWTTVCRVVLNLHESVTRY